MNKVNEKISKETNQTNQSTFKEKIREKLNDSKMEKRLKNEVISESIIKTFKVLGYFINSGTHLYYFCEKNSTLYDLNRGDFEYLIHTISGINPTDTVYNFMRKEIEFHTIKEGKKVEIKEFSYFNKKDNTLYIFNNGNKIIKISEEKIEIINNGSEGIIFLKKEHHDEWFFDKNTNNNNQLNELLESIKLNETFLKKDEYIIILKNYIYSLFFPNLLLNRPILLFVGEKGSGKSYFFEVLLRIMYGENISLGNIPSKDDDLKVNLISEYLCIFDNVDGKIENNKVDLLCSVATGTSIKARKLYSNNEMITTKVNCFVGITSRSPHFKRDDLCDRMIIVHFDRRDEGFESSSLSQEVFLKNRHKIMSQLCLELQSKLKEIKVLENNSTKFRVSDFSNFTININKDKKEDLIGIFNKLIDTQQDLTNSTDSLVILMDYLIEDSKTNNVYGFKQGEFYKASELHRIFSEYANDHKHLVKYNFHAVKSLSKTLNQNQISYKNINKIDIETKKLGGNYIGYSITKI